MDSLPDNIFRIKALLEILAQEGPDIGCAILRTLSPVLIRGLGELCYNLLAGHLPLTEHHADDQQYFRRHKPLLRCLANNRSSKGALRKCLSRKSCYEPLRRLAQITLQHFRACLKPKHGFPPSSPLQLDSNRAPSKTPRIPTSQLTSQRQGAASITQSDESDPN